MDVTLEQLIHSPKLSLYYQRIQDLLEREKEKRQEFYRAIKESDKGEFINGQTVFQFPVKSRHAKASFNLAELFSLFVKLHALGWVAHEKVMVSLTRNDYEPDICFFNKVKADQFASDQMKFPAPTLVVEVLSPSTEEIDRGIKFEDYAAHGVGEYWIVDPETETVEQYVLRDEEYALLIKARSGVITSSTVQGFEIPIRAIFDSAENLATLQRIVER